jgi:hypothetical protein
MLDRVKHSRFLHHRVNCNAKKFYNIGLWKRFFVEKSLKQNKTKIENRLENTMM